jgi:hypothetical protein
MEILEDKIIRQKINSLDSFPDGYEPNLESKWNVIEAGLDERNKKKMIISWYRIVVAAMLFIIGVGSVLLISIKSPSTKNYTEIKSKPLPLVHHTENEDRQKKRNKIAHHHSQKITNKSFSIEKTKPLHDSLIENKIEQNFTEVNVASMAIKIKKPRYVEVDFNTQPIITSTHSESILASQPIKFKLGMSVESSSSYINEGRNFKLYKSISN